MSTERKSVLQMAAELTREGGVLVGVFGFLEGALKDNTPSAFWFLKVALVSLTMMAVGVLAERFRP